MSGIAAIAALVLNVAPGSWPGWRRFVVCAVCLGSLPLLSGARKRPGLLLVAIPPCVATALRAVFA